MKLPKNVTPTIADRDFTIATLVAPSALKKAEGDTSTEGEAATDAEEGENEATEETAEEGGDDNGE